MERISGSVDDADSVMQVNDTISDTMQPAFTYIRSRKIKKDTVRYVLPMRGIGCKVDFDTYNVAT